MMLLTESFRGKACKRDCVIPGAKLCPRITCDHCGMRPSLRQVGYNIQWVTAHFRIWHFRETLTEAGCSLVSCKEALFLCLPSDLYENLSWHQFDMKRDSGEHTWNHLWGFSGEKILHLYDLWPFFMSWTQTERAPSLSNQSMTWWRIQNAINYQQTRDWRENMVCLKCCGSERERKQTEVTPAGNRDNRNLEHRWTYIFPQFITTARQ